MFLCILLSHAMHKDYAQMLSTFVHILQAFFHDEARTDMINDHVGVDTQVFSGEYTDDETGQETHPEQGTQDVPISIDEAPLFTPQGLVRGCSKKTGAFMELEDLVISMLGWK
jgi:hypothetical protein